MTLKNTKLPYDNDPGKIKRSLGKYWKRGSPMYSTGILNGIELLYTNKSLFSIIPEEPGI
jgi:hypothetical protein